MVRRQNVLGTKPSAHDSKKLCCCVPELVNSSLGMLITPRMMHAKCDYEHMPPVIPELGWDSLRCQLSRVCEVAWITTAISAYPWGMFPMRKKPTRFGFLQLLRVSSEEAKMQYARRKSRHMQLDMTRRTVQHPPVNQIRREFPTNFPFWEVSSLSTITSEATPLRRWTVIQKQRGSLSKGRKEAKAYLEDLSFKVFHWVESTR